MSDLKVEINESIKTEQRPNGGGDEGDARGSQESSSAHRYARMPVDRNAQYYNMNHKHRGIAIIFNHEHFDIHSINSRTGTNVDSNNLSEVLNSLGFRVTIQTDLISDDVNKYLRETSELDHTDNDCLLIAVLTHGEKGLLYAKNTLYKADNLWYYFTADKCPSLAGKPKLFFIQACQGDKLDAGITLVNRTETEETDGSPSSSYKSYKIPTHADFLVAFSTVPGYFSWRNTICGTWFIQALCEELRHSGTENNILTLLTFVAQRVALDYETNSPDNLPVHQQKQMTCFTSMLMRLLVFNKK